MLKLPLAFPRSGESSAMTTPRSGLGTVSSTPSMVTPRSQRRANPLDDELKRLELALEQATREENAEQLEALLAEVDRRPEPVRRQISDRLTPVLMRARQVLSGYLRTKELPDNVGWIPREITEMKKYKVPPRIVRDVLLATFLLLGELDLDELTWGACRARLHQYSEHIVHPELQTKQRGIVSRMLHFRPAQVSAERVHAARLLLAPYTFAAVCDASEASSSFYLWATNAVREWDAWNARVGAGGDFEPEEEEPQVVREQTPPPKPATPPPPPIPPTSSCCNLM